MKSDRDLVTGRGSGATAIDAVLFSGGWLIIIRLLELKGRPDCGRNHDCLNPVGASSHILDGHKFGSVLPYHIAR